MSQCARADDEAEKGLGALLLYLLNWHSILCLSLGEWGDSPPASDDSKRVSKPPLRFIDEVPNTNTAAQVTQHTHTHTHTH